MWDVSHTPMDNYDLDGEYSSIADHLRQNGFEVEANADELTMNSLWDSDILIISILSNFQSAYSTSEIERIVSFVDGGGGLIILGDNTQARPQNLAALTDQFGMSIAAGDNIGNLTQFADHEITTDIDSISFFNGSAITVGDDGQILGSDENDLGGLGVYEGAAGMVFLLGDADAWSNAVIDSSHNLLLALNTANYTNRDRLGIINMAVEWQQSYLSDGHSENHEMVLSNSGEGILEAGVSVPAESEWIRVSPRYVQIDPGESAIITVTLSVDGIEVGDMLNSTLTIYHNQPDAEPMEVEYSLNVISDQVDYFNIPDPSGIDHSIIISNLTIGGIGTRPGIQIGAFSEDGLCVGGAVYMGDQIGLVARGDDPFTEEVEGFANGEAMQFRLFTPWDDVELETSIEIVDGEARYRADGFTILNLDGRSGSRITLNFNQRWSLISLNLRPPSSDFNDIFAPLLDAELLIMVKDGNGHFWNVEREFNNLGDWDVTQGYHVQVRQIAEFEITGVGIDVNSPIVLSFGWSIIPYLPAEEMNIEAGINSIVDRLIIAKGDDGAFYIPEWDWNGIGNMVAGEGYQVKLAGLDTLIYPNPGDEGDAFGYQPPRSNPSMSGIDMSVLLIGLQPFTSVRFIDYNGVTVGFGESDARGRSGISTWGDDISTDTDEGLSVGESFQIILADGSNFDAMSFDWLEGDAKFSVDGLAVGRLRQDKLQPKSQTISISPNPFNSIVTVRYNRIGTEHVTLSLFDINGRELMRKVVNSNGVSNKQEFTFSADGLPAGVIIVKIQQGTNINILKTVHLP